MNRTSFLVIPLRMLRIPLYSVGNNLALALLGVPSKGVKGTDAWWSVDN